MLTNIFSKTRFLFLPAAIGLSLLASIPAHAAKSPEKSVEKGYTINFDNVPIQEFLKFVSKIAKVNVIYNDDDLNFNVTIVSEEQTNLQNIMSALVQVLRIHGLTLIEEEQNLLIHRNEDVKQIPTVVSSEKPINQNMRATIMTKVFKIEKGNPSHIASLITPMLSREAIVEVSMETRQLIITDVASSLETIQDLLLSLDAPETPYDIELFTAEYLNTEQLVFLSKKILAPIVENTTLELIAQPDTQNIYIVSTPFLIKRAVSVLQELDRKGLAASKNLIGGENVYIYKLKGRPHAAIEHSLMEIAKEASGQGYKSETLVTTIEKAKYIAATNSLMFVGPSKDLTIIASFLTSLEGGSDQDTGTTFLFFESSNMSSDGMMKVVTEIVEHLKKTGYTHPSVIIALENAQVIEPIDSILFTGRPETLAEVKSLLMAVESSYLEDLKKTGGSKFLIYQIKQANEEQIRKSLHHLADYLETNNITNEPLVRAIDSMRWIKATNSLMFIGNTKALEELNQLLPSFDVPPSSSQSALQQVPPSTDFIIYSPKRVPAKLLQSAILSTAQNLKSADLADPALIKALESVRILENNDQLIFTGDALSLKKLSSVLLELDQENTPESLREGPYFIHLQHASYSRVKNALTKMSGELPKGDPIREMVDTMHYLSDSNAIVLRGPPDALKKIKDVIELTDTEAGERLTGSHTEFIRLSHRSAKDVLGILHETADRLKRTDSSSDDLIKTLEEAQAMTNSNTIIITGTDANLAKVRQLIANDDQPYKNSSSSEVFVYKLKYMTPEQLQIALRGIADHAHGKGPSDSTASLTQSIDNMRVVPNSDAVQFVGPPEVIVKLKEIITLLDTADNATSKVKKQLGAHFLVYAVKNSSPTELLSHLKQIAKDSPAATHDTDLMKALASGRYAKDSNSLVFSGDPASLDKIQGLLEKLDANTETPAPAQPRAAEGYQLYRPEYVPGPQLVQMIKNFEDHLVTSGVTNHSLAEVVDHLSFIPRTNTIVITGPQKEMEEVIALLKQFDNQETATGTKSFDDGDLETIDDTGFLLYKLQHQPGDGLVSALQQISMNISSAGENQKKNQNLIEAIRSIQFIQITNTLMATGQPKTLSKLRELLQSLDRPLKQVFIEILVLETTINKDIEFGLRWGTQGAEADKFAWGSGNYGLTDGGTGGFTSNFNQVSGTRVPIGSDIPPIAGGFLGVIGDVIWHKGKSYASLGSMVNAIKTDGDTTVVLSQKIICQDTQNAKIFSGDNIPFTGSLVTTSGLTQTTNANLEYRNIGVTVSITPLIGDNGVITLDIDHEISEEANLGNATSGNSDVSSTSVNGIRTTRTTMSTKVHMPDKHFLILSGTMRNQVTRAVSGIPCLGGLPLVGAAFSQTSKVTENRNVIIFVKPHIIDTNEAYAQITQKQEDLYGSKNQCNTQDFSSGLELVRSPDDQDYEDE